MDTSGLFGHCVPRVFGKENNVEVPITCLVGDSQSSLFGHCCFESGDAKATLGTGCFLNVNTGIIFLLTY